MEPDPDKLVEEFFRPAAGPGGQHLNKTTNGVRLIFDYLNSEKLSEAAKSCLTALAGAAVSGGKLVISERSSRSLQHNRETAYERLCVLLSAAVVVPRLRKKTKATRASKERRLAAKTRRSEVKSGRRRVDE